MHSRKNSKKKRAYFKKPQFLLIFSIIACLGLLAWLHFSEDPDADRISRDLALKNLPLPAEDLQTSEEARLVYPYSVIPGGVRSPEELAAHMAKDRVVSDHYSDFTVRNARIVKADKTRMMYVSYRMDDKVYWTGKKIRIPEGEPLITDGDCEARTRCGNRVSASPMEPVADDEPLVETFDIPQLSKITPPELTDLPPLAMNGDPLLFQIPGLLDPALSDPPDNWQDPGITPFPDPDMSTSFPQDVPKLVSPDIPVESDPSLLPSQYSEYIVPEPSIVVLLTVGLAAIFACRFIHKK